MAEGQGIFSADSALMRTLDKLSDVVVLNLVFVATSLPLLTLGASLTALHQTSMRLVRGRSESVVTEYLAAFRAHLRSGSLLLLAVLVLAGVLGAWYAVVNSLVADQTAQLVLLAVWFVVVLQLVTTTLLAFPYLATFDDPTVRVLRNAWMMSLRHPLAVLTVAMLTLLPVVITVYYPQLSVYGLFWLVIGFAGIAVLTAMVLHRVFDRYVPTSTTPHESGSTRAHA